MACSPDGSQSVWKRTLSAASAMVTSSGQATAAAMKPDARIACFISLSPAPGKVQVEKTVADKVDCSRVESRHKASAFHRSGSRAPAGATLLPNEPAARFTHAAASRVGDEPLQWRSTRWHFDPLAGRKLRSGQAGRPELGGHTLRNTGILYNPEVFIAVTGSPGVRQETG